MEWIQWFSNYPGISSFGEERAQLQVRMGCGKNKQLGIEFSSNPVNPDGFSIELN